MCGRFTRYLTWTEIHGLYRLTLDWEKQRNDEARFNIARTQDIPFVTAGRTANTSFATADGGSVPFRAKESEGFANH